MTDKLANLEKAIRELQDLYDDPDIVIPASQLPEKENPYKDFMDRNPMAGGGMLVQPSADGSRPGYAKDKRQYISAEEKYTGSAKPPKKKKWQGVFGKEKADEIYNDYVKFYTDAYNNKNMSQVGEAEEYFKKVYGDDGRKASDLLKRNGYTNLKAAPYELKQKLLIELVNDAQGKIKFTNKFDIIDKVFTESAAKQARANGLSSFLGKSEGRQRLSWFGEDLFNKVNSMDKIDDKISKALDYMVENNIEIKDVKKATGSVFTQGTSAGDKSRMSPIKKTIVSLVDNGKDGISRALLNKGLEKNAWYQSQTQNGKNLFDYVAREYGTEFIGEGFLDAYESGKSRFGRVTVKGSTQMPLPESLIFQFAARSADRNFKAGTYEDGPVKITNLKGNELDFGSLPVNERGQRIIDPSKHKFTYNGTLYGKNNLRKLGYQSGDFTEVYQIASDFKSYSDELVPNPKNPNGKKIPFRQLMDMSGIDLFMAIGHDDSKGGVRTRPFNNFQIQNKFVNKSLDSAYRQVKNKDLRKRIADDIYGDLKGLRGQAYKDAWIKNNTKLLNDIILNRNIPPSLYRQAGENIIKSDVFQTFSKKKQDEVIRVSGLNKTQVETLLASFGDGTCAVQFGPKKRDGGRIGYQVGTIDKKRCIESGVKNFQDGKFKTADQAQDAAKLLGGGQKVLRGLMKYGIVPEAAYVAGEAVFRNILGEKPLNALKKSVDTFTFGLTDFTSGIEAKKFGKDADLKLSVDKFRASQNKVNSIEQEIANLETLNTGSQFGYEGDQTEAIQMKKVELEAAKKELEQNYVNPDMVQYIDRKGENIADAQMAKSGYAKASLKDQMDGIPGVADYMDTETARVFPKQPSQAELNLKLLPNFRESLKTDQGKIDRVIMNAPDDVLKDISPEALDLKRGLQEAYKMENLKNVFGAEQIYGTQGSFFGEPLAKGGRAGYKTGSVRKGVLSLIDKSVKSTPKDTTSALDKLIKQTLDEDLFDKKDRIIDNLNARIAKAKEKGLDSEEIGKGQIEFYDNIIKSNFRTKTGPFFDYQKRKNKAGGGLLKQAGDRSGPPPESGPNSQGLQGLLNRVKKG